MLFIISFLYLVPSKTAEAKIKAFNEANVPVANQPDEIPGLLKAKLGYADN